MTAYIVLVMNGGVLITLTRCPNSQIMHPVTQGTASGICIYRGETERAIFHVTRSLPVISESGDSANFQMSVINSTFVYLSRRLNLFFNTMHYVHCFQ